jgi:hypothetical protein
MFQSNGYTVYSIVGIGQGENGGVNVSCHTRPRHHEEELEESLDRITDQKGKSVDELRSI